MKTLGGVSIGAAFLLLSASFVSGEVRTVVDRNDAEHATPSFKFEHVPSPAVNDAASGAKFSLVGGAGDPNGGGLDVLHDGELPTSGDDPAANFFFSRRSEGGRILVDLGKAIEIQQVNTYSWHAGTRAPQVYKLYAADGAAPGFDAAIKPGTDPAKAGWKFVAAIDSRPKAGAPGGQYGVSVEDSEGSLGRYRYLLFDVSRTESDDPFGNTFYSEIDVIDRAAPPVPASQPTTQPTTRPRYQITIDTTETPELADWAEHTLRPVLEKWYPMIVEMLPSEGYSAPRRFSVTFYKDMKGVANTGGTKVHCAAPWFEKNLKGEAVGAVVHEMVHVVQQYHSRNNPGWLVEGIADYVRWFKYEPKSKRPHPDLSTAKYTDSYRTTAAFLNFVAERHDKDIAEHLNAAMRQGKYSPELWTRFTGKSVDELWAEYAASAERAKGR